MIRKLSLAKVFVNYHRAVKELYFSCHGRTVHWGLGAINQLMASYPFAYRKCWMILQPVLGWHVVSLSILPTIIDFVDCYKSVTTQIPHEAGYAPIPYDGETSSPIGDRTSATSHSTSSKQCALNHMIKGLGWINVLKHAKCKYVNCLNMN